MLGLSGPLAAQQQQDAAQALRSPILVIDFDELLQASAYGQRIQSALEESRRALAEEIAAIDAEMAAEEKRITRQRSELTAEAFRDLADAFDAKVQRLREEQDEKALALNREQTEEELRFRQAALPIIGKLMLDSGALIIVEKRNLVMFNDGIDMTAVAARRLDAALAAQDAEGTGQTPGPEGVTAPEAQPEPQPESLSED